VKHPTIRLAFVLAALSPLLLAPAASAAVEDGDAGDLPATAQDLSAEGVERIDGVVEEGTDVDMYRLCLSGGGTFSASSIGGTTLDTQLFLFDSDGRGVYANDDEREGVLQSRLPSGHALTPQEQGVYFLAVGIYNIDPLSSSGLIFPNELGVVGPTGEGGDDPVTLWGGRPGGQGGAYTLFLTGAECPAEEDTTPPTVDLRSPVDGAVVTVGDRVEVDFSCDDEGGSELASCVGTVPDGGLVDTSMPGPRSVTVTARDNAGNETSVTHTVTVVTARDSTPPVIELRSPHDGATYVIRAEVRADYACADEEGGSGLASCSGPVADGALVDTASVGPREFTVVAADRAGNISSATVRYRVLYDFEGFLWPVRNRPRVNWWPAGVPVPIRFGLGGNLGLDVVEKGWPQVAEVDCDFKDEAERGEPAEQLRWIKGLLYFKRKQRYLFLWKTERDWAGSCRQFILKLKDGTVKRADFKFRRWHGDDD
jgi:hypothetical protein